MLKGERDVEILKGGKCGIGEEDEWYRDRCWICGHVDRWIDGRDVKGDIHSYNMSSHVG
jgi:hypothetical protein